MKLCIQSTDGNVHKIELLEGISSGGIPMLSLSLLPFEGDKQTIHVYLNNFNIAIVRSETFAGAWIER